MNECFILRLKPRSFLRRTFGKEGISIVIESPAEHSKTEAGLLGDPPEDVWSVKSNYSKGVVEVEPLSRWLRECVGERISEVIRQSYPSPPDFFRLMVTADEGVRPQWMKTPWEALEWPDRWMLFCERLGAVRVLDASQDGSEPLRTGYSLNVAVLWANPRGDITDLNEHLDKLTGIIKAYPTELSLIGPVEFSSVSDVRDALADKRPHIVYHIGHAAQKKGQEVKLLIGPLNKGRDCSVEEFRGLLNEVGPPRLLLLNSCAAAVGEQLNPYLGAALRFASEIEAVITMQTEVTVGAATRFAEGLFRALFSGKGTAEAVKRGRESIARGINGDETQQRFAPFIPVLLQRTRQDKLFEINLSERELRGIVFKLKPSMESIPYMLDRAHDEQLRTSLDLHTTAPRVTIVLGPQDSGKSTSVRRAVDELLTEDRYKKGERLLYYEAREDDLQSEDEDRRILQLLVSLANYFSPLTGAIYNELKALYKTGPGQAIRTLANWLQEEDRDGKRYCVCIDSLPSPLAATIALRASGLFQAGALILISDEPELQSTQAINRILVTLMTDSEIRGSLKKHDRPADDEAIAQIMAFSNGYPYFVAGYLRNPNNSSPSPDDLASNFLQTRLAGFTDPHFQILRFSAVCESPVPEEITNKLFDAEAARNLVDDDLLVKTGQDSYHIAGALRNYFLNEMPREHRLQNHANAFDAFVDLAQDNESSPGETTFALATQWFREAFRHAIAIATLLSPEDERDALKWLDSAGQVAQKLHERCLKKGRDVTTAKAVWEQYREAAYALEQYDNRAADAHYADCLIEVGEYDLADEILEQVTFDDMADETQISALQLRANLIKERGRSNEFDLRIELLEKAITVALNLEKSNYDNHGSLRQQMADVDYSLGNALGYGKRARPGEAIEHLERARKLFDELGDFRRFRAVNECIEIKHYNRLLSDQEREEAIETLIASARSLVARAMRYDLMMTLYELGRLEKKAADRARWFRQAFERAHGLYEPESWHAAISWRIEQVKAGEVNFEDIASNLKQSADNLARWHERAWSRRKHREALLFLVEGYSKVGDKERAIEAARECWSVVLKIAEYGEGRKDPAHRFKVARLYAELAFDRDLIDEAQRVVAAVAADLGADASTAARMNRAELEEFLSKKRPMEDL